jgi:hypothetical protein
VEVHMPLNLEILTKNQAKDNLEEILRKSIMQAWIKEISNLLTLILMTLLEGEEKPTKRKPNNLTAISKMLEVGANKYCSY